MKALVALIGIVVTAALSPAAMSSAGADRGTVIVRSSSYGKALFDGKGFVLYAFTKDQRRSACYGSCATAWPPYLVTGAPKAGPGVDPRLLGTTRRSNGKLQVTYAGRPLYYYVGDRSPGEIRCQNVYEFGGLWVLVRPTGKLIR